jgi:hypothetical protein
MEKVRRRHQVDRAVPEGELVRISDHTQHFRAFTQEEQVIDLEIEPDPRLHLRHRLEQVRGAGPDVEDRPRLKAPHQRPIHPHPAHVVVDAAQVPERLLHVLPRRVMLVEELVRLDACRCEHQ